MSESSSRYRLSSSRTCTQNTRDVSLIAHVVDPGTRVPTRRPRGCGFGFGFGYRRPRRQKIRHTGIKINVPWRRVR